jgi:hypothetical protein
MRNKDSRKGNRLYDIAKRREEEAPVVVREQPGDPPQADVPDTPDTSVYLDPDPKGGRARIVVMLTEDASGIEPLFYTNMSYIQAVSNLSIMSNLHVQELMGYLFRLENQHAGAMAEIELLREKLAQNIAPPRDAVQPPPLMPRAEQEA